EDCARSDHRRAAQQLAAHARASSAAALATRAPQGTLRAAEGAASERRRIPAPGFASLHPTHVTTTFTEIQTSLRRRILAAEVDVAGTASGNRASCLISFSTMLERTWVMPGSLNIVSC